jgi:hypothetical protein
MPNRDIDGDTEGFGLVFLEAACAGKPAVAGTAGGTGSAVVDGVTGLRVDGERLEAIAQALARLLSDPAVAQQMGLRGRKRVLETSRTSGGRCASWPCAAVIREQVGRKCALASRRWYEGWGQTTFSATIRRQ